MFHINGILIHLCLKCLYCGSSQRSSVFLHQQSEVNRIQFRQQERSSADFFYLDHSLPLNLTLLLWKWIIVCWSVAGGKHSSECTLILTEGDSAKSLAVSGLGVIGRDRYGVFPLRGKILNVREATHKQVSEQLRSRVRALNLTRRFTINSQSYTDEQLTWS